jgi:hypothetical protein
MRDSNTRTLTDGNDESDSPGPGRGILILVRSRLVQNEGPYSDENARVDV